MSGANTFALVALLAWVPISAVVFARCRAPFAAGVLFLGGLMFLPQGVTFDAPALPALGKEEITSLCVLLGAAITSRAQLVSARPGRGLDLLVVLLMLGGLATGLTNRDALVYGPTVLQQSSLYDGVSIAIKVLLRYGLPFYLGRALFRSARDLREILMLLAAAGVVYSLFVLVEIRMSPQFHKWVYGFHQHSFGQTIRFGGYRPMVFMAHGLAVALFIAMAMTAAGILGRARLKVFGFPARAVAGGLAVILVLCKSVGAAVYGAALLPAVSFLGSRQMIRVAMLLVALVASYPVLRTFDVFPTEALVGAARVAGVGDRADSLAFRFKHEDRLVAKAQERVWFGWGGWSRNRVYDPENGRDISVTDGSWIILLGSRGVVGLAGVFGLLLLPVVSVSRQLHRIHGERNRRLLAGLAVITVVFAVDALPNAFYTNVPFLLSGALYGLAYSPAMRRSAVRPPAAPERAAPAAARPEPAPNHPAPAGLSGLLGPR